MTSIYVIGDDRYCKIGISDHPEKRLSELQTGNPSKLTLHHSVEVDDRRKAELIEGLIHKTLKDKRMDGGSEWFSLTPKDAVLEVNWHMIRYDEDPLIFRRYR